MPEPVASSAIDSARPASTPMPTRRSGQRWPMAA